LPGGGTQLHQRTLGAVPVDDGIVEFRVWAPNASHVAVRLSDGDQELEAGGDGAFEGRVPAAAGADYWYVLDGGDAYPDPCARFQPEGIRGPSRIVDTTSFAIAEGLHVAPDELVIYELHIGTFSQEGTFDGAIPYLPGLRELGVTAVEVMPVATFPGNRGWGYDGVYAYAPHPAYGGPEGLARFVDAAHRAGLAVLLDVVYNHIGPGSEAIAAFGPYFTDRYDTFWGDAIDYSQDGVREWAIQNALMWTRDYKIDGLRLDAVHAIYDDSHPHVFAELKQRVDAIVTSEMEIDDWRPIDEWGHDGQWFDRSHHELHVLLTGEHEGYYADYGTVDGLAEDLRGRGKPPNKLIVCAQNHDQVGNRALGDRLTNDALRVAAAVTLFSPCTPLLFMGEEYGEQNPFQFFADHIDPFIADATREGRKKEFEKFSAFSGEDVPDPQDAGTFTRSKLSRREDAELRAWYAKLLRLRRELPRELETRVDGNVLRLKRGGVELVADFAAKTVELIGA
jgi:maltooligosyltrehalose trehalohydrolase